MYVMFRCLCPIDDIQDRALLSLHHESLNIEVCRA
jgi:hypothetical protein